MIADRRRGKCLDHGFHSKVTSGVALIAIASGLVAQFSLANRLGTGAATTLKKICLDLYQITVP